MLAFELHTSPPPVIHINAKRYEGIEVPWPVEETWDDYMKRLAPIGSLGTTVHEYDWLNTIKSGHRNLQVTIVAGYSTEPTGGIIMMGARKVSPYILAAIYIPSTHAAHNPNVWVRQCDGASTRLLNSEEVNEVLKNDKFLSIFEDWRQKTNFEGLERDSLGASQRQVQSEDRTDGANQRHITI